ncbi:AraC family transcriptional regulator [Pseudomonas sp. JQ170]|uniref:AraC family transcriptional regulator n=1 Tax=unclassified Pseudomonas TaxID=196821 RepID=UPI0026526A59|nr:MULTISPECIES: AraC family transcriptional regulator [unclassified Pseudomonas]MDN7139910.1 AraC family transcriptional regulator [Pseudomonas sp. JQ170]WRO73640.1 AraC family transcriptional regulator [Pseudomonas sp. 170C]
MLAAYKGTTSISLVREALYGAAQRGLCTALPLQQACIDPQLLTSPNARVSAAAFSRLWVALSDMLDDEFFAIDSHPLRRGSFRLMCHATMGCETLEQALRRILAFLRLGLDDLYGELQIEGNSAQIIIHDHGIERRLFSYGTWLILVHGLLCWLGNRRIPLQALSFRTPRPIDDSDYRMRFCEHIEFGAPVTVARFDPCFLKLKVVQTHESLATFLRESPASLLVKYRNDASLSAQVRQRLRNHRPEDWPALDEIANQLSMSSSTLQRRLQAEGESYQGLKDNLRRDMAINFLGQSDLTVCEVAAQAGFQETSAFHRAFKKWTGVSPGAYRRTSTSERRVS